ncbi:riboflavin transporter MCH5 [Fusarium solani]|uniref:Riboflavin transporter MCH5 n=1 Tax=Fusarium solani TaxID=169388 RepID=A0A9P9G1I7_FUSSL|nr:riboflavin transporter MCH5 [Fusarium solani]KAH7230390.1 riboflavin transporter MCH5 [Fusarium solani]
MASESARWPLWRRIPAPHCPFELEASQSRSWVAPNGSPAIAGSETNDDSRPRRPANSVDNERKWKAWLCVLGSFLFMIPSYGFMQSVGTIQSYLSLNQLSDYSARDIGWITGMYTFLTLFLSVYAGLLVDIYSLHRLAPVATALTVPMFFLLGECKLYWHFMLCLGVLGGIGAALTSSIAVAIVGKLFVRLRGLAMGVALAGSSLAGVVIPLILRRILPTWGAQWSFRTLGFIVLAIMVVGTFCMLPFDNLVKSTALLTDGVGPRSDEQTADAPQEVPWVAPATKRTAGVHFSVFKSPAFSFICGSIFLLDFVIFGITGMLPTIVSWSGFPVSAGYTMVAVLNGASCVGRVLPGLIGDRFGHYNVLIGMIIVTIICTGVILVPFGSTDIVALYVFSGLWGLGSGSFVSLGSVCIGKTCEARDYGRYYGALSFAASFGLLITVPVGGQMLESMGATALSGLYLTILCLGCFSAFASRSLLVGTWLDLKTRI